MFKNLYLRFHVCALLSKIFHAAGLCRSEISLPGAAAIKKQNTKEAMTCDGLGDLKFNRIGLTGQPAHGQPVLK